ncbi:MAG: BolA family transcriptional regulator [Hahellaceae bacterium]|jgi:acid stress-induced BolA-like protein IbaG/YrbA|nr:BolA family transcriptional regulator [Hahellaceae bacterium]MCP5211228.1 BolA family transcriptional regulator [Hahellaceae bacterium]
MLAEEVQKLVKDKLPDCEVHAQGEGNSFQVTVIGDVFNGMSPVKKQQLVYSTVTEYIADGRIHAFTIKAYTPEQWDNL